MVGHSLLSSFKNPLCTSFIGLANTHNTANESATKLKASYRMSGKSQKRSGILLFPYRPRLCRLMKPEIVDTPDHMGWSETNRDHFYFPDASKIFAMVGDHCRHMKPQICTVRNVGDSFSSSPIL